MLFSKHDKGDEYCSRRKSHQQIIGRVAGLLLKDKPQASKTNTWRRWRAYWKEFMLK